MAKCEKNNLCLMLNSAKDVSGQAAHPTLDYVFGPLADIVFYRYNLLTNRFDYVSPSSEPLLGLSPKVLYEMHLTDMRERLVHPEDQLKLFETITYFVSIRTCGDKTAEIEYRLKVRNGEYRWFCESLTICGDKTGIPSAIIGQIRDITEIKTIKETVRLSEEKNRYFYDHIRTALFRCNVESSRLLACNAVFAWMMGFSGEEKCMAEFCLMDSCMDFAQYSKFISELRRLNKIQNYELAFRRKDGSVCWTSITAFLFQDLGYFSAVANDVTAVKVLTPSETEVLRLLLAGMYTKEIATKLDRSRRTIEEHRANVMKKLNARTLVDLAHHYISLAI